MVKGLGMFRDYFAEYTDQYVLIGGAACDISFHDNDIEFRATKDLDVVLIVEVKTGVCFDTCTYRRFCLKSFCDFT